MNSVSLNHFFRHLGILWTRATNVSRLIDFHVCRTLLLSCSMVRAISRPVFFLNVIREILFTPLLNTVVNDVMIALFLDNLFIFPYIFIRIYFNEISPHGESEELSPQLLSKSHLSAPLFFRGVLIS